LDKNGFFSLEHNIGNWEKQFFLTWITVDGYQKEFSLILDQDDVANIYVDASKEKVFFEKGDVKRKEKINRLIENIYFNNHEKVSLVNEEYEEMNKLIELVT
jgi:hypothetical protein